MIEHLIKRGSEIESIYGVFSCEYFNGNIVFGREYDYETQTLRKMAYTLSEIALLYKTMDGKNHRVVWDY